MVDDFAEFIEFVLEAIVREQRYPRQLDAGQTGTIQVGPLRYEELQEQRESQKKSGGHIICQECAGLKVLGEKE